MKTPGLSLYKIIYENTVVKKDIPDLPHSIRPLIKEAIEYRLMTGAVAFGKPLRFSLKGLRRIRISDYRVIYDIDVEGHSVRIIAIKHRKAVYE